MPQFPPGKSCQTQLKANRLASQSTFTIFTTILLNDGKSMKQNLNQDLEFYETPVMSLFTTEVLMYTV